MPSVGPLPITNTHPDPHNASIVDWNNEPAEPVLAAKCQAALSGRLYREGGMAAPPKLFIDPLTPLPLADAADGVVKIVYFILASRPYGEETINRNVVALQKPGALEAVGANDSNLFLVHVDAKLGDDRKHELRDLKLTKRPDVYVLQKTRPVLWAGWSMILALWDVMTSVVRRGLTFEYFINLSDADLTLRTDTEIRAFLSRWPGRSIMSIVQRKKDPRRYKMHELFRSYCFTECEGGAGFVVSGGPAHPAGFTPDAFQVIGKRSCCWSRTAPILYSNAPLQCPNAQLPATYHGSQWATLHHALVRHMVDHPFVRRVLVAMEHTLLPDEATLQVLPPLPSPPYATTCFHPSPRPHRAADGRRQLAVPADDYPDAPALHRVAAVARRRQQVLGVARAAVPRRADGAERLARARPGLQVERDVRAQGRPGAVPRRAVGVAQHGQRAVFVRPRLAATGSSCCI